jgi:adenine-specific DNA-methyltransferase
MALSVPVQPENYGEVFTRQWVVDLLLDLTGYTVDRDLGALNLLDPSCGSGAFLRRAVERLLANALAHDRPLASLDRAIRAYDLQLDHVELCRDLCRDLLKEAGASFATASELAHQWVEHADFLLSDVDHRPADLVVGNPPYIRYDDLPDDLAAEYRDTWSTMRGRGDIYVGFIERSLRMLAPNGRLGFICADRWMRNQYGAALRELVVSSYSVEHVWNMHDVDAFESEVSAYPAIIVLSNRQQGNVMVADTTARFSPSAAAALYRASQDESITDFADNGVKAHRLPHWFEGKEPWPTGSPARLALIEHLNDKFGSLHDPATGTKVGVGLATGADKVYVTRDPAVVEADRMLPLAMRRDLASGVFDWQGNYLVNPWADDGTLVALHDYPRMTAYLSRHRELRDRHVAKREPDSWYRTIDKVNAELTTRPKLLFQDMKATIEPVLEPGGHYPHHNLYYVVSDTWDLEVLGGLLLSRIAQAFIEAYCVRMRGGTLRFQAQYLKRIKVPRAGSLSRDVREALRKAFCDRDVDAATDAAATAYGINLQEYELDSRKANLTKSTELDPTLASLNTFWSTRSRQKAAMNDGGAAGGGARAAGHLSGIHQQVTRAFLHAGIPAESILDDSKSYLPGYYRPRKRWDMAIRYKGTLVAALEFKSQVGSVGKNINNRFEEALGTATDTWTAQTKYAPFGDVPPWLGYVFVLQETEETEKQGRSTKALFAVDEAFVGMSYNERYQEMLRRFIGDNVYQAGWFITTSINDEGVVSYAEPLATASGKAFCTAIEGRVNYVKSVLG